VERPGNVLDGIFYRPHASVSDDRPADVERGRCGITGRHPISDVMDLSADLVAARAKLEAVPRNPLEVWATGVDRLVLSPPPPSLRCRAARHEGRNQWGHGLAA
jgi:hypothetical protein